MAVPRIARGHGAVAVARVTSRDRVSPQWQGAYPDLGTLRAYPSAERNMHTKSKDLKPASAPVESDTDTSSYDQSQGGHARPRPEGRNPKMPHERDESAVSNATHDNEPRPPSEDRVEQAHNDVKRGLVDTDRRGMPDDIPAAK
jgi:hypothetical protein